MSILCIVCYGHWMRKKYENLLIMTDGRKKMPYFLGFIADIKNYKNIDRKDYQKYDTSMDLLHVCIGNNRSSKSKGSEIGRAHV